MKKFSALFLALAMLFALATTAFAAGTGTITIENATIGKEYTAYKLFDVTYSGGAYSYHIENTSDYPFYAEVSAATTLFSIDAAGTVTQTGADTDIIAWVNALNTTGKTAAATVASAAGTTVTLDGLDDGYYFVTTNNGTTVTITNVDPNPTVIDKNLTPGFDDDPPTSESDIGKTVFDAATNKWVDKNIAEIGDTVQFNISARIPGYEGEKKIKTYTFTDTLDSGFAPLSDGDVTATIYRWDGSAEVLHTDCTPSIIVDAGGKSFTVTLDISTCADKHGSTTYIRIKYATKLAGAADFDSMNTVQMNWTYTDSSTPPSPPTDTTTTNTYKVNVQKYKESEDPTNKLGGAKFELYDEDTTTLINVVEIGSGNGEYRLADATETGVAEMSTSATGALSIHGLGAKTYHLKETVAPDGYNKLLTLQPFTVSATGDTAPADGTIDATVNVINNAGTMLPETGGIGTTLFITFGALALILSGIFLVTNKRMKKEFY